MSPRLPGASCWRVSRVARRRAAGDTIGANLTMGPVFSGVRRFYNPFAGAESEVRGSLDVLKVIFMDHTFQPRAAETLGNLRCLLGGFDRICERK